MRRVTSRNVVREETESDVTPSPSFYQTPHQFPSSIYGVSRYQRDSLIILRKKINQKTAPHVRRVENHLKHFWKS